MTGRVALALALALALVGRANAQPRPDPLTSVGVADRIGERVPPELMFSDADGRRVRIGDVIEGRPVLLVLSYVRCRLLCSVILRGAVDVVRAMPLALERDYRLVIVSIDPREELASAAARLRDLRERTDHLDGVHYLVGAERPVRALAQSVGFGYAWDPRTEQYAHPAVLFVLTPDGIVSSYLEGVQFDPDHVAEALRRAARRERGVSESIGESVLHCFAFDPAARAHRELIEAYLRTGAAIVASALMVFVGIMFARERRRWRR